MIAEWPPRMRWDEWLEIITMGILVWILLGWWIIPYIIWGKQ